MHPRSSGSEKIVRTEYGRFSLCMPGLNFASQAPASLGGKSYSFPDLILMSTLTWITQKELE